MVSHTLKTVAASLLVGLCALAWSGPAQAQTARDPPFTWMAVVVHPSNTVGMLTRADVRRIFLRERTVWPNGETISVLERPAETAIRSQFDRRAIRKSPAALAEYWLNLRLTRGLDPPRVCPTAGLLKLYLQRLKGGVGYLYEHEVDHTTRVIAWIAVEP
jgi:hypothetical protein